MTVSFGQSALVCQVSIRGLTLHTYSNRDLTSGVPTRALWDKVTTLGALVSLLLEALLVILAIITQRLEEKKEATDMKGLGR